jgi:hypothetical protein
MGNLQCKLNICQREYVIGCIPPNIKRIEKKIRYVDSSIEINEFDIQKSCIVCWNNIPEKEYYECYNCNIKFHKHCYEKLLNYSKTCCHCQQQDSIFNDKQFFIYCKPLVI